MRDGLVLPAPRPGFTEVVTAALAIRDCWVLWPACCDTTRPSRHPHHNAGVFPFRDIWELDFAEWKRIQGINLDSQFLMAKAVMGSMRDNSWGRIVNIASNSLGLAVPNMVPYMAAKGGVIGFTRALATDLAPHGITVNAICPTGSRTPGGRTGRGRGAGRDLGDPELWRVDAYALDCIYERDTVVPVIHGMSPKFNPDVLVRFRRPFMYLAYHRHEIGKSVRDDL